MHHYIWEDGFVLHPKHVDQKV